MAETSTLRPGGESEMALNRPQHLSGSMSQLGQSRKLARLNGMSVLPSTADVIGSLRHVRFVPTQTWRMSSPQRKNRPNPSTPARASGDEGFGRLAGRQGIF